MALRNLTNWNDPIFYKISKPVTDFNERLHTLLDDMLDTLKHVGGYGCAAVYIGILRRVVVVNDKDGVIELVNPVITDTSDDTQEVAEGSIAPGAPRGIVTRPKNVTIEAFDRHGVQITVKSSDFLAATFCHEIDHLNGIRFIDKARKLQEICSDRHE